MATFTRHFSAQTQTFHYKYCIVTVSEDYRGYDNYGHPSYFIVNIVKPRIATREDLIQLQHYPHMKTFYFKDGNTIYYYDIKETSVEVLSNLPIISYRTIKWAIEKAKEMVDQMNFVLPKIPTTTNPIKSNSNNSSVGCGSNVIQTNNSGKSAVDCIASKWKK